MDAPQDRTPVAESIGSLAARIGVPAFIEVCVALLGGADREEYLAELPALTGHAWQPGDDVLDRAAWHDSWVRTWGARGLVHVWDDAATGAVVRGLDDTHWRPAEMCLKVVARHDVAGAGDGAARLAGHELPRVRAAAVRALALAGDTEHLDVVEAALDDEFDDVREQAARTRAAMARRLDLR